MKENCYFTIEVREMKGERKCKIKDQTVLGKMKAGSYRHICIHAGLTELH